MENETTTPEGEMEGPSATETVKAEKEAEVKEEEATPEVAQTGEASVETEPKPEGEEKKEETPAE